MDIPFVLEKIGESTYRIQNQSDEIFEMVTVAVKHDEGLIRDLPNNSTFEPNQAREFSIIVTGQSGRPTEIEISWDTQPDDVRIPLPVS